MSEHTSSSTGISRRGFLKTAGVLGASAFGATNLCACSDGAVASADESAPNEVVKIGHCVLPGCFNCDYNVVVRDGRAVNVEPLPDAPYGRRPCVRARANIDRLYSDKRIKYPMKRVGERGSGQWERISWDEAISTICEKWKGYIDEYGPRSILFGVQASGSSGLAGTAARFRLSNMLQTSSLDNSNDWGLVYGSQRVSGAWRPGTMECVGNTPFEIDINYTKTMIFWSRNLSESAPQRFHTVMDAQQNGTKIIVVDPNYTTIAARADRWFRPRPGTDTALALSMAYVLMNEGYPQEDVTIRYASTGPLLVKPDSGKFLHLSDLGLDSVPTSVDDNGEPVYSDDYVVWDEATQQLCAKCMAAVPALEGSYTAGDMEVTTAWTLLKERVGEYPPETAAEIVGMTPEEIVELAHYATDAPVAYYIGLGNQAYKNGHHFGTAFTLLSMIAGGGGMGSGTVDGVLQYPYDRDYAENPTGTKANMFSVLSLPEILETGTYNGEEYPIKALYVAGYGFISGLMDVNKITQEVLPKIEFYVCADTSFSDSALWADIVLPVSMHWEVEDVVSGSDSVVRWHEPMVEPMFEGRSDYDICRLLAQGLGVGDDWPETISAFLEKAYSDPEYPYSRVKADAPLDLATEYWVETRGGIFTESGLLELYCDNPKPRYDTGYVCDLKDECMPRFCSPGEAWFENANEQYPIHLMSERSKHRFHGQGFESTWLAGVIPEPILHINPEDAEARGINDGDYVEVFNDRGHVVLRAEYDCAKRPGVVTALKGWQMHEFKEGSLSEVLTLDHNPMALNTCYQDTRVEIRKWEEA